MNPSLARRLSSWRWTRRFLMALGWAVVLGVAWVVVDEVRSSRRQAAWLDSLVRDLTFQVQPGPSPSIRFPGAGPFDERLGYHQLPALVQRLRSRGFVVTDQARMAPRMIEFIDEGLFVTYREKAQAGLELCDCRGRPLAALRYPERTYERFESVPPLLVDALLFIEDRDLLDPRFPMRNPAIEWDRFGKAVADQAIRRLDESHAAGGGSTLATQIEKFRHSPDGRTDTAGEKLRQMISASLRAYVDGENTLPRRRQIVMDYLNTVPLSAQAGLGEVNGLGDGLWAWYGRDFAEVNQLLRTPIVEGPLQSNRRALAFKQALVPLQALAFKQALSLMVAQRRPAYYLGEGEPTLRQLTDSYLRVMADAGVISPTLRDAALPLPLKLQAPRSVVQTGGSFVERKAVNALRGELQRLLAMPRSYDLDRLDLAVQSSLDGQVQHAATALLRSLGDRQAAQAAGLVGFRLFAPGDDTSKIMFSFTLYERGEHSNLLRVQTDSFDQPFDLNVGARLDLGSTAKLRTLVTYLELTAELHRRWSALSAEQLAALKISARDPLARWAREHLMQSGDKGLAAMLDAAMQRRYAANPDEGFFTGGGLHHFVNFEPEDNRRTMTVSEALTRSVNLVFIRLMRDVVRHVMARDEGAGGALLDDASSPQRHAYLARFADMEGREFVARFYRKHARKPTQEAEGPATRDVSPTPPGRVRVHPLERWVEAYLDAHPTATLDEAIAASAQERQTAYQWLFSSRRKAAQDSRIRSVLEADAFAEILKSWRRLGYPFESLTPSYATALGASGDRPASLAELMGLIVNRGVRLPVTRVAALTFARGTPYETRLAHPPGAPDRVLAPEIADVVRRALIGVVEDGTAKRLKGALVRRDGSVVEIGGKTGTGDHRFDTYGPGGKRVSSRVVDRSATLVFFIGERYFGTMMAYVHEPYASKYKFTSALPAQLLKVLTPVLRPLVDGDACSAAQASSIRIDSVGRARLE